MVYNEKGWKYLHSGLNASYLLLSFTDLEIMLHNEMKLFPIFFFVHFFFFRERALTASWQLYRRQLHNTDGACCLRFGNRIFIFLSYISLTQCEEYSGKQLYSLSLGSYTIIFCCTFYSADVSALSKTHLMHFILYCTCCHIRSNLKCA